MKKLIVLVSLLIVIIPIARGQGVWRTDQPSLFILPEVKLNNQRKEESPMYFRLFNNSKWAVRLDVSGGEEGDPAEELYYSVVTERNGAVENYLCHVCSVELLKPRKSILFSIPPDRIKSSYAFRVAFQYQWESDRKDEPLHFVVFYLRDLKP